MTAESEVNQARKDWQTYIFLWSNITSPLSGSNVLRGSLRSLLTDFTIDDTGVYNAVP